MEVFFSANNIGERGKGLTFNDVLLVPRHGDISSRRDPSLKDCGQLSYTGVSSKITNFTDQFRCSKT